VLSRVAGKRRSNILQKGCRDSSETGPGPANDMAREKQKWKPNIASIFIKLLLMCSK
jgi:hypothetical protein